MNKEKIPASKYIVTEDFENSRLDNFLLSRLKGIPRSRIYSIIRKGEARVNGSRSKPSKRLTLGEEIRIPPYSTKPRLKLNAQDKIKKLIKENIIFEDQSTLVINKPIGIASHGGSGISLGLIEIVRQLDRKYKNAHLVHRLDKDTSGCILVALKKSSLREFHSELRNGNVKKNYIAIVKGKWPSDLKKVEVNLKKNQLRSGEREVQVTEDGKKSITKFKLIKPASNLSLLKCELLTGKTHQIRVHVKHAGFPIVGDKKYGDREFNNQFKDNKFGRMFLHSQSIFFPSLRKKFSTNQPSIFLQFINQYGK